jgi:replicative DNA helicase
VLRAAIFPTVERVVAQQHSPDAEASVVGQALADPSLLENLSVVLDERDFYNHAHRAVYAELLSRFYAEEPLDAVTIANAVSPGDQEAIKAILALASKQHEGQAGDHALVVRRYADARKLLELAHRIEGDVAEGEREPRAIAGQIGEDSLKIATGRDLSASLTSFGDAGQSFLREMSATMAAQRSGYQAGVLTKIHAIDSHTRGLLPTELYILAAEPGAGKSTCAFVAAHNFALAQSERPPDEQVGTLILSLEMGEQPVHTRFAQMLTGLDSERMRQGTITDGELEEIRWSWKAEANLPLYLNYAGNLKTSQMRAIVAEAVRRHNVGFVVVDHFRRLDLDKRLENRTDEDEEKAKFLKVEIAKALNVAVLCLAHTRKIEDPMGRPRMSDLRGSGQIVAEVDFLSFLYRPAHYATMAEMDSGDVLQTDAEMIWAKNRHGGPATSSMFFDPAAMRVR